MKWFTIDELCYSATANAKGISNVPTADVKKRLELLVSEVLDPVREAFGKPIIVNSGYRSERLNKAIGDKKALMWLGVTLFAYIIYKIAKYVKI